MQIVRFFRHLFTTRWTLNRAFDAETRQSIERAISESEKTHRGELRFAVEADLGLVLMTEQIDGTDQHLALADIRFRDQP